MPQSLIQTSFGKSDFNSMTMFTNKLVSSFILRFHKKMKAMMEVLQSDDDLPSQFEHILTFLDKLDKGITNPDQRTLLLNYRTMRQNWHNYAAPPLTLSSIEMTLTDLESRTVCKICNSSSHTTRNCPRRKVNKDPKNAYEVSTTTGHRQPHGFIEFSK